MIALDTNVLVRSLVGDDPIQARSAQALLASLSGANLGFVCREVVVELVWVLGRSYRSPREEIASVLFGLLSTDSIVVENAEDVAGAAAQYATGVSDFADLMILAAARRRGAMPLYPFDRRASRVGGVELLAVEA